MVFLFNKTTICGANVEMVAGLGAKLNKGMNEARALRELFKRESQVYVARLELQTRLE
jgi:hypothetical protein